MSFTLGNVLLFFVEYEPADLGKRDELDILKGHVIIARSKSPDPLTREGCVW